MYTNEQLEAFDEMKEQLQENINTLKDTGVRKVNIEIELLHFIKRAIYPEKFEF